MKLKELYFTIFTIFLPFSINSFQNILEAQKYAAANPEFPAIDSVDYETINYKNFYKNSLPNFWQSFFFRLNLQTNFWSITDFLTILNDLSIERMQKYGLKLRADYLEVKHDTNLIVWGDLHGAFHSLVRALTNLISKKIIDSNFKILRNDTFLIFSGNVIDLAPYSLETLTLVLKLMKENPNNVVYIKGRHEYKEYWQNYSTRDELQIKAGGLSNKPIPFAKLLNDFFYTLPIALFVRVENSEDYISISSFGPDEISLKNLFCTSSSISKNLKNLCDAKEEILPIKAFIKEDNPIMYPPNLKTKLYEIKNYKYGQGLYQSFNFNGITTWTLVSCPILLYRMKYDFPYDAFVKIKLRSPIRNSTIRAYYNDDFTQNKFKKDSKYNLITSDIIEKGENPPIHLTVSYEKLFEILDKNLVSERLEMLQNRIAALEKILNNLYSELKIKNKEPKSYIKDLALEKSIIEKAKKNQITDFKEIVDIYVILLTNFNALVDYFQLIQKDINAYGLIEKQLKIKPQYADLGPSNKIRFGNTSSLSGSNKVLGIPVQNGIFSVIQKANMSGGINNKFIELISLDDSYIPNRARTNIEKILDYYHTDLILFPEGTPTTEAWFDYIKEKKVYVIFPQTGASFLRDPKLTNVIHWKPSFVDEGFTIVDFAIHNYSANKITFFYQDDDYGNEFLSGAIKALKSHGIKHWNQVPYQTHGQITVSMANKIKEQSSDALVLFATVPVALQLIRLLGVEYLATKLIFSNSDLSDDLTKRILEYKGVSIIMTQLVPDALTSELEIVQEYRRAMKQNSIELNTFSLESFIITKILLEQVSKIEGVVTGEKIMKQFENIKDVNFKGLHLNFDPTDRKIMSSLWIRTSSGMIEKNVKDQKIHKRINEVI